MTITFSPSPIKRGGAVMLEIGAVLTFYGGHGQNLPIEETRVAISNGLSPLAIKSHQFSITQTITRSWPWLLNGSSDSTQYYWITEQLEVGLRLCYKVRYVSVLIDSRGGSVKRHAP
jgi:hypothetical protein